jgi:hypothetical protein
VYVEGAQGARTIGIKYPARARAGRAGLFVAVLFVAGHVPAAILVRQVGQFATLHALLVFAFGLAIAVFGRKPMQVGYVAAYITGAEVLWRMSDAQLPWEFGKYAIVVLFVVALARVPRLRLPAPPLIYLALLLPATLLTLTNLSAQESRQQISFNLSGPLALAACAAFFAHVKLSRAELYRLFLMLLAPVVGIASVTLFGVVTAASLSFGTGANSSASGGFGPNQVSAALGLGALVAFWFVMDAKADWRARGLAFATMLLMIAQSALTFSRGGLYDAAGAILLAALFLLRSPRARMTLVAFVALLSVATYFFVMPHLDAVTGGALFERFQDTSLTGRDVLIQADLGIWLKNPVWGVGPGRSALMHLALFRDSASHTEFSRMLAEHGALGLASMLLLCAMALRNISRARGATSRAVAASLAGWGFLFMLNVAMRTVAPSFLIGLTFARLLAEDEAGDAQQARARGVWTYAAVDSVRAPAPRPDATRRGVRGLFTRSSVDGAAKK